MDLNLSYLKYLQQYTSIPNPTGNKLASHPACNWPHGNPGPAFLAVDCIPEGWLHLIDRRYTGALWHARVSHWLTKKKGGRGWTERSLSKRSSSYTSNNNISVARVYACKWTALHCPNHLDGNSRLHPLWWCVVVVLLTMVWGMK